MTKTFLTTSFLQTKKVALAALVALSVFYSGCKKDEDSPAPTPTPTTYGSARYFHVSPDAGGVDVLVDGNKVNSTALTYTNETAYLQIASGTRNIKVNTTGTTTTLVNASATIAESKKYSVFVADELASIETVTIEDNLAAPPTGKAHLRFINMVPDGIAVDIAQTGGPVIFSDVSFKEATAFIERAPSNYNLQIKEAGTSNVLYSPPAFSLAAGKIYTILARGLVSGTGTQGIMFDLIENN